MDAFVTVLITLMPFFAMLPLAVAGVLVVALIASPRVREAFGDWMHRRLRPGSPRDQSLPPGALETLYQDIARLEDRVGFLERVVTESPRLPDRGGSTATDDEAALVEGRGESR